MKENNKFMIRRTVGVMLVALGLILVGFLSPIVVAQGVLAELVSIWFMAIYIAAG